MLLCSPAAQDRAVSRAAPVAAIPQAPVALQELPVGRMHPVGPTPPVLQVLRAVEAIKIPERNHPIIKATTTKVLPTKMLSNRRVRLASPAAAVALQGATPPALPVGQAAAFRVAAAALRASPVAAAALRASPVPQELLPAQKLPPVPTSM